MCELLLQRGDLSHSKHQRVFLLMEKSAANMVSRNSSGCLSTKCITSAPHPEALTSTSTQPPPFLAYKPLTTSPHNPLPLYSSRLRTQPHVPTHSKPTSPQLTEPKLRSKFQHLTHVYTYKPSPQIKYLPISEILDRPYGTCDKHGDWSAKFQGGR